MSKIEGLPKALPAREIPFSVEIKGTVTKHVYKGDFTVRVPLTGDMSRMGVALARLNNGVPHEDLDLGTATLNNSIAYLRTYLVDAPKWFTEEEGMAFGLNTVDTNVPIEIFNQADDKVKEWRKALEPKEETADEPKKGKK